MTLGPRNRLRALSWPARTRIPEKVNEIDAFNREVAHIAEREEQEGGSVVFFQAVEGENMMLSLSVMTGVDGGRNPVAAEGYDVAVTPTASIQETKF
jgi:predicted RNase H-like nuclease